MDTKNILADLRTELNRLNQAIAALESLDGTVTATTPAAIAAPAQSKKRGLTPAGRRRLSAMMKARWAARRKQFAKPAAAKPASKKTTGRRTVSAASRKKMAEAQRKRWAVVKKAAVKKPANKGTAGKALAKKAEKDSSDAGVMGILKSVFQ
jgi:hypothetical protein